MPKRTMIPAAIAVSAVLLAATPAMASIANDAAAASESRSLVNQARAEQGRGSLAWNDRLSAIARAHSEDMARDGELRHNDDLPREVGSYQALAENVGYGQSASQIHDGFMGSSDHRANILGSSFTQIGVGAVRDDHGTVWITQIFYRPQDGGSSGGSGGGGSSNGGGSGGSGSTGSGSSSGGSSNGSSPAGGTASGPSSVAASSSGTVRAQASAVRSVRRPDTRRPAADFEAVRTMSMLDALTDADAAVVVRSSYEVPPRPQRFVV